YLLLLGEGRGKRLAACVELSLQSACPSASLRVPPRPSASVSNPFQIRFLGTVRSTSGRSRPAARIRRQRSGRSEREMRRGVGSPEGTRPTPAHPTPAPS